MQPAIGSHKDVFVPARRKHCVEMRGESDIRTDAILYRMRNDVTATIDARYETQGPELRQHPLGTLLFKERGGRDAAQL